MQVSLFLCMSHTSIRNFYESSSPLPHLVACMIHRLQERDEQVALEIVNALTDLFKTVTQYLSSSQESNLETSIYECILSDWKGQVIIVLHCTIFY